jgi:hypothetical protein
MPPPDLDRPDMPPGVKAPAPGRGLRTSGPNEGYRFSTSTYSGKGQTETELEEAIRDFLNQVDPTTGYIQ